MKIRREPRIRRLPPKFREKIESRLFIPPSLEERRKILDEAPPEEVRRWNKEAPHRHAAMTELWLLSGELGHADRERRGEIWNRIIDIWPGAEKVWKRRVKDEA
jgi:hypothetical protein